MEAVFEGYEPLVIWRWHVLSWKPHGLEVKYLWCRHMTELYAIYVLTRMSDMNAVRQMLPLVAVERETSYMWVVQKRSLVHGQHSHSSHKHSSSAGVLSNTMWFLFAMIPWTNLYQLICSDVSYGKNVFFFYYCMYVYHLLISVSHFICVRQISDEEKYLITSLD